MACLKCAKTIGGRCGCLPSSSNGQGRSDQPRTASSSRQSAVQQPLRSSATAQSTTSLPPRSTGMGSGSSGGVQPLKQQWDDKFSHIKAHLQEEKDTRMQSVNGNALILAHKALEADCERAAKTSSEELRKSRHKLRFQFEMSSFALKPKSEGHHPDVMLTLFKFPVNSTMFEVPEYQGPLRSDCVPKWTMGKSRLSVPPEDLFDLGSPWFEPASYTSWRDNIRAGWILLGTHYKVHNSRAAKARTRITIGHPLSSDEKQVPLQLPELKRIAQAVVHFEEALQMLMPKDPEQRRNWQDNATLKGSARPRAIAAISKAANHKKLTALLCPSSDGIYCWDFQKPGVVIIVQPGASETAAGVISTVDLLLTFIAACLALPCAEQLQRYSPDKDGLSAFLVGMPPQSHPIPTRIKLPHGRDGGLASRIGSAMAQARSGGVRGAPK